MNTPLPSNYPKFEPLRRNYVPQWTAPERAIQDAVDVIERSGMGGDNITHAINLLHVARSLIADAVDAEIKAKDTPSAQAVEDLVWLARRAAGSSSLRHFIPIREDANELLERHGFNKETTE